MRIFLVLTLICAGDAGTGPRDDAGPAIVFDNRPEFGVPPEALDQQVVQLKSKVELQDLTAGTIKTIRIRYFNKETWATEEQARDYVRGFLLHKPMDAYSFQIWSQGVATPEIECIVEFTKEHMKKLILDVKEDLEKQGDPKVRPSIQGRLLIWKTESCFRDAAGRWWFVNAFDYFHAAHPKGQRELAKPAKSK